MTDGDVTDFLAALDHPLKREIGAAQKIILGVSSTISVGVKWNAPSFRTAKDWYATVNLRSRDKLQLIFHLGAKKRPELKPIEIADPRGLMQRLAPDRAMVTLGKGRDISANGRALSAIVRAWIRHV